MAHVVTSNGGGRILMACGCGSKNKSRSVGAAQAVPPTEARRGLTDVMNNYRYLKPHQIKARLEIFKRNNCAGCEKRYACDYQMYLSCKGTDPTGGQ